IAEQPGSYGEGEAPRRAEREEPSGPRRLRIQVEETTDEAADLRRIRKLCAALDRYPATDDALPVEFCIRRRDQSEQRLARGTVAPSAAERLIPELQALLGVLGTVREMGAVEVAERKRELAVVGGG